jgi:hypothetical protein
MLHFPSPWQGLAARDGGLAPAKGDVEESVSLYRIAFRTPFVDGPAGQAIVTSTPPRIS